LFGVAVAGSENVEGNRSEIVVDETAVQGEEALEGQQVSCHENAA